MSILRCKVHTCTYEAEISEIMRCIHTGLRHISASTRTLILREIHGFGCCPNGDFPATITFPDLVILVTRGIRVKRAFRVRRDAFATVNVSASELLYEEY